jgi:enoyl-CoA hydratase/carnithine racemase
VAIDFELREAGIAVVTINRPERANALDVEHFNLLAQAWERVRDDKEVRVAIVTGAGEKAFCAGGDMKASAASGQKNATPPLAEFWMTQKNPVLSRGLDIWKPVIAAVNGHCIAGGMHLLMATDIRVAAPNASFALTEASRGVMAVNGGTQRILSQVPYAVGMEMMLTGKALDAEAALRFGFVNCIVPLEQLMATALDYARRIAAFPPLHLQAAKEMMLRSRDLSLADGMRMEQFVSYLLSSTEDGKEGTRAFAEKRKPHYKGR